MLTEINESIKVMAVFDARAYGLRPVKFRWRGRLYPVREITHTWRSKEGLCAVVHFSVTDGGALYEIAYNQDTMAWSLEGIEA